MTDSLIRLLEDDHARLDALLEQAVADPDEIDEDAYMEFRRGLLRHIGIEEKLFMSKLREAGGEAGELAHTIRQEHSAIALLLVPPPTHALVGEIRTLLTAHNPLEEGPDGMYAIAEGLLGDDLAAVVEKARNFPAVPPAPYRDGPRVHYTAESALAYARQKKKPAGAAAK